MIGRVAPTKELASRIYRNTFRRSHSVLKTHEDAANVQTEIVRSSVDARALSAAVSVGVRAMDHACGALGPTFRLGRRRLSRGVLRVAAAIEADPFCGALEDLAEAAILGPMRWPNRTKDAFLRLTEQS
jgi:hypothetical protein